MKLSKIRLCVFGTTILNEYISQNYKKNNIEYMCIITHQNDFRDYKLLKIFNLFPLKKNIKCDIYYFKKYEENKILKILEEKKINFGISSGCRFIFKNKIIKFFKNNFFNIHNSYLPFYKGGAPDSYAIMNQEKLSGISFHKINNKIDDGEIVFQKKIIIKKNSKPIDLMNSYNNILKKEFFKFIKSKKKLKKQNKKNGFYFPRLNTELNGYLNVNWPSSECISFINSFSDPYPGAQITYQEKKIFIKQAKIFSKKKYHTFLNGKITNIGKDYIRVIMGNNILELKDMYFKNKKIVPKKFFKLGETLYNSNFILSDSKIVKKKYI